jgi:hypothetical protein
MLMSGFTRPPARSTAGALVSVKLSATLVLSCANVSLLSKSSSTYFGCGWMTVFASDPPWTCSTPFRRT